MKITAGVDEAGRGPIAGPVVAAAVILPEGLTIDGVRDSKQLSESKRELLYTDIVHQAVSTGIGIVHEDEIDRTNILIATRKAMRMALGKLDPQPQEALIDGRGLPDQIVKNRGIPGGDDKVHLISAASIVAKVTRDRLMRTYDIVFPEYNFARHKGYGTEQHFWNLRKYLACSIHRRTFNPVMRHVPTLNYLRKNRLLGGWGERMAATKLVHKGYEIIGMNYNAPPYGEIDIISRKKDTLVFVEVKTASQTKLGAPEEKVDDRKINRLENAFEVYLNEAQETGECRFDMMTVIFGRGKPTVKHYRDCLN